MNNKQPFYTFTVKYNFKIIDECDNKSPALAVNGRSADVSTGTIETVGSG